MCATHACQRLLPLPGTLFRAPVCALTFLVWRWPSQEGPSHHSSLLTHQSSGQCPLHAPRSSVSFFFSFWKKKIWTCLFFSLKHELLSQSYKRMEHSTAIGGVYTVCHDQIRVVSISFNILKTIWLLFNHYMFLWGSAWCFHAWMQCVLITSWYNSISVLSLCLESFSSSLPVTIKRLVGYCEGFPHPCVVLQHLKLITHVCVQVTHTHTHLTTGLTLLPTLIHFVFLLTMIATL